MFGFPKRDDIKVRCDAEIVFYLREHEKAKNLKIEPQPDGSVIVTLSQATEYDTPALGTRRGGEDSPP